MSKKVRIRESVIEEKADVCFPVRATLQTSVYASVFSLNVTFLRKSSLVAPGHLPLLISHPLGMLPPRDGAVPLLPVALPLAPSACHETRPPGNAPNELLGKQGYTYG